MKALDALVRACGGDPLRVRVLRHGLAKAAEGRLALLMERQGSGFAPDLLPILVGAALVGLSLILAIGVAFARSQPVLATFVVAAAQGATCLGIALFLGTPALLADDDASTLGWWPVTARDVALARLALLVRPVLAASLAVSAAPLLAHAVFGPVPVLSGLGLAFGLLLQAAFIVLAVAAVLVALCTWLGRRRAQYVVQALAVLGALAACLVPLAMPLLFEPDEQAARATFPLPPEALPPAWFASWGRLGDSGAPAQALGSLALVALAGPLAFWLLGARDRGALVAPERARPLPAPVLAATRALLAPFMPGREGFTLRTLFVAHLREDWRHAALRAIVPAWAAAFAVALLAPAERLAFLGEPADVLPVRGALLAVLAAAYLPLLLLPQLVASRDHRASWLLAQADLDPMRLLSAERRLARALLGAPLVLLLLLAEARGGAAAHVMAADALLVLLAFEASLGVLQRFHLVLPFSRPWDAPPEDVVLAFGVGIVPVSAMTALWMAVVHDRFLAGKLVTWALLVMAIAATRRSIARAIARRGLAETGA